MDNHLDFSSLNSFEFFQRFPDEDACFEYLSIAKWQIELFFKAWKSLASIDKIKKAKRERIESHMESFSGLF